MEFINGNISQFAGLDQPRMVPACIWAHVGWGHDWCVFVAGGAQSLVVQDMHGGFHKMLPRSKWTSLSSVKSFFSNLRYIYHTGCDQPFILYRRVSFL